MCLDEDHEKNLISLALWLLFKDRIGRSQGYVPLLGCILLFGPEQPLLPAYFFSIKNFRILALIRNTTPTSPALIYFSLFLKKKKMKKNHDFLS